jgi:hypothetical protein
MCLLVFLSELWFLRRIRTFAVSIYFKGLPGLSQLFFFTTDSGDLERSSLSTGEQESGKAMFRIRSLERQVHWPPHGCIFHFVPDSDEQKQLPLFQE